MSLYSLNFVRAALLVIAAGAAAAGPAHAMELREFEAYRALNARDLSRCIDLRAQTGAQRARSLAYESSLRPYLRANVTDADRARAILGHLAGAGTDDHATVFIFYAWTAPLTQPGQAFRADHRQRLNQLVAEWRRTLGQNDEVDRVDPREFIVRFDDECDIPVADWK